MNSFDLYPKRLFHAREEIVGKLVNGDSECPDLHVVVQYPLDGPGQILGRVFGTQDDAERLRQFLDANPDHVLVASSRFGLSKCYGYELRGSDILFKRIVLRSEPEGANYNIAELLIGQIEKDELFDEEFIRSPETAGGVAPRHLTFFLGGPANVWGVYWYTTSSFTGRCDIDIRDSIIDLGRQLPFKLEFIPWFFTDEAGTPQKHRIQTSTYALSLTTTLNTDDYSDKQFLREGKDTADKLARLSSLVTGSRVGWYGYSIRTNNAWKKFRQSVSLSDEDESSDSKLIINTTVLREFLVQSYNLLCDDSHIGDLLQTSIDYYTTAKDSMNRTDERFIWLFLALEKMKDVYAKENGLELVISKKEFKKGMSTIEAVVVDRFGPEKGKLISAKLLELNRYSFKEVVKEMLHHYDIDISDLYPPDADCFGFIKTRNKLFHSRSEIDGDTLFKESKRLEFILSRLFLRIFGWQDLSCAPKEYYIWAYSLRRA